MASEGEVISDDEPDVVVPDNDVFETDDKYRCSECDEVDKFVYTISEEDACCKSCYHKRCDDCAVEN
ncbi:hypothetical protein F5Y14DRAFT_429188 [Nemania sp. NC0429]|nr:hypothetical protein F5Y14DRAFT_429188 [Nemania sp. NC0429]